MDDSFLPRAQPPLIELEPQLGTPLGKRLRVLRGNGERAVFLGDTAIHIYDASDRGAEAAAMALLAHAGVATHVELAAAFGVHRNTVGRLEQRFEQGGMAGVVPAKPGPKGPHKITPEVKAVVQECSHLGCVQVTREIERRTGVRLHWTYVSQLLRQVRAVGAEQPVLVPDPEADGEVVAVSDATTPAGDPMGMVPDAAEVQATEPGPALELGEPPVVLPAQARGRYMGASLYYPALQGLGLLDAGAACFRLAGAACFGVRAVLLTLFFLSLVSKTTVEAAKHLRRWEFGPLVGAGRAPAVKTLRRKLEELIKQGQASRFGELLARRWVEQGVIATAYLYVDGHVKVYTGKRKLAECWNSQRRMPLPGLLTYFVNDQQGRPLLFITEEANASLAQVLPKVVAATRLVVGERRFTMIFDRGGYDGKLFTWLGQEGIDFITYQRGEPGLPAERFGRRECHFEGRRVRMWLAEDEVRVGGSGPWRRIVVRTKDGHQTPILTSLTAVAAAKIACLIFARWRQENFFKYSKEHHGLDQLLGSAWAEADGARLVPNPERKQVERELRAKRQELAQGKSALGQVLLDDPGGSGRPGDGIKIAHQGAVGRLRALEKAIDALLDRRRALPTHVPLAEAGPRAVLRLEQKAIIDRIKLTAYNAEEWLLELLAPHYPNPHDVRALLRSFAELSGEIRTSPTGVAVTLDAPDLPLHRRALRGLCADLNQLGATFPGADLPVHYDVVVHHSEALT
ncbi:MAG: helix-turn-helix domain-containing protein [Dehalococcoidia bacterium]|nr:helix-turn-helix domain-containing protein [Dehalococcoidia bacterium]